VRKTSRVTVHGAEGRSVIVPAGKSASIVFLVGFESPQGVGAGKHTTGTVTQVLDWSGTEDEVLARFTELLAHLATLEPVAKAKRELKPKKDAPKGFTAIPVAPKQAKADRKALIEDQAKRSGKPISAKTKAELESPASSTNGVAQ
ncbi:MAG: hypothetical protein ACRDYC_10380, partial [Acidimicrobiales bacterium]